MRNVKVLLGFLFFAVTILVGRAEDKVEPAKIEVHGMSWFQNRETRGALKRLWGSKPPATLSTIQIEDAALFLASYLSDRGFQRPTLSVAATLSDGSEKKFVIDLTLQTPPPNGLQAKRVSFEVEKGVQSYLGDVKIAGLSQLGTEAGRAYFLADVPLFGGKGARSYSPAKLDRSADALQSTLRQKGYAEATVKVLETNEDVKTGEVIPRIQVVEGPLWTLDSLDFNLRGTLPKELEDLKRKVGDSWSLFRGQDLAEQIRHVYYSRGYPDVRVRLETRTDEPREGARKVHVVAHVAPGEQVGIGEVRFEGQKLTKESVLRRRVELGPGEPLNPLKLDKARYRLGRLGVFHSIDLHYRPEDGPVRDPVFEVVEEKPLEVNLMAGWGSYEGPRGGVELIQRNVFGRAHQSRLQLVESLKSTRGDYTYTVPEIFGETVDGTAKLFGLQREERSFVRQEYGGTITFKHNFPNIPADGTIGYTFQSLRNRLNELSTRTEDERLVNVASVDLSLSHDGRDNPLRPRRGYRWYAQAELADNKLGGQATYQRIELGGSYHTSWGSGRWVHAGLSHGFVTTLGSDDDTLPVNKRFYPGGESSIRGYQEGEAAPRDVNGLFIGAKSYLLANLEVEQALTSSWSIVAFTDALGAAASLRDYPFDDQLVSIGLGLRYHTLIGPVRIEYGHNIKRRDEDPHGTLHFSVGFPF